MELKDKIIKLFLLTEENYRGIPEKEIAAVEQKLNIRFPEVLRNFYLLFGNNEKMNINCESYRIEDVYIDENQYLVIGKQYFHMNLYGISIADITEKNPVLFYKTIRHDRIHKTKQYLWENEEYTLEEYILDTVINSGFDGGLKYRFSYDREEYGLLSKNRSNTFLEEIITTFELSEIEEKSFCRIKYYAHEYNFIMRIYFDHENIIEYIKVVTENREFYEKVSTVFFRNGLRIERDIDNYSKEFEIYEKYLSGAIVHFYPGKYEDKDYYKVRNWSISVHEDAIYQFYDILKKVNNDFDIYGIYTYYDNDQVNKLIDELGKRVEEMRTNQHFGFIFEDKMNYYKRKNIHYRRYKNQIIEMLITLIEWLQNLEKKELSVMGI